MGVLPGRAEEQGPDLRPVRGQHVVVTNPGLTEFFSEDTGLSPDLLCFYPHGDTVVLGGTAIDGEGDLAPDDKAAANVLARCAEVEPRLAEARVLEPDRRPADPLCSPRGGRASGGWHRDRAQLRARRRWRHAVVGMRRESSEAA
ncbi:hypothetical protein GCM10010353_63070 [Streptomyces chryseus]|nr:hypothetical protein GCM10010353_63070 [Streptomyces chryseus]